MLIFVYGTLKRGFYNYRFLEKSNFIGTAITNNKYPMINSEGYFPYLINDRDRGKYIKGEVFEINNTTLKKLDVLEGFPDLYIRDTIDVKIANNTTEVVVYFLNDIIDYNNYELLEEFIEQ